MRKGLVLLCLLSVPFSLANSDEIAPEGFVYLSAESLHELAGSLSKEAAADAHHAAVRKLADFPNEYLLLAHREADGTPEVHETEADVFVILSGSRSLLVGGTLANGDRISPHELRNGVIQGGRQQKLAAGDVIRIPPRMPHQLLLNSTRDFTYLVVKVRGD
jgi:mannose-6-phosphate isomerase-like protein (cupin superfamily)